MKRAIAMLTFAFIAGTLPGAMWTGTEDNVLENPNNWINIATPGDWSLEPVTFVFATGADLVTAGFTNQNVSATATNCTVTFGVQPGGVARGDARPPTVLNRTVFK